MSSNRNSGGISLCTVLLVIFIVLKLCGLITWSWIWVLSPLWIQWLIFVLWCIKDWIDDISSSDDDFYWKR